MDPREAVAIWMIANGYATGHGDTLDHLLWTLAQTAMERGYLAADAHWLREQQERDRSAM